MRLRHGGVVLGLIGCLIFLGWGFTSAEPSFELTARYILDIVKAFRTAYVLHVVEHTRNGGLTPREDWESDSHLLPLPAQFVKAAAGEVRSVEIGLISLTPVNPANRPRTDAEAKALINLEQDRSRGFVSFVDGDQFKAMSADLALVRSCVDCHNHHPRAVRRNFQQWDVMGALVVRMNRDAQSPSLTLPPDPLPRPPGTLERLKPPAFETPWGR
ncbi:c-type heme family protein [Nitrospira sp. Nam80]